MTDAGSRLDSVSFFASCVETGRKLLEAGYSALDCSTWERECCGQGVSPFKIGA